MSDQTPDMLSELPAEHSDLLAEILAEVKAVTPIARAEIAKATDGKGLDEVRVNFLGKKGRFAEFNKRMGALSPEERPIAGRMMNLHKGEVTTLINKRRDELDRREMEARLRKESVDVTLPGVKITRGSLHPVVQMHREIREIFRDLGFEVESGPEIESEWMNFEALNFPADHPARDMQDTLYTDRNFVLRTHTSPTQIRTMLNRKPPMAVISSGRVYRHDSDATHSPMFHQMEGFAISKDINFGHLKGVLHAFLRALFGEKVKIRFRPSFFPFTEPSAEIDVWSDARNSWMEVLGSGMIHPNVLKNGGVDPEEYSGFAFGLGIDRLAMIKFGIPDLRLLFENDVRFLRQF